VKGATEAIKVKEKEEIKGRAEKKKQNHLPLLLSFTQHLTNYQTQMMFD